MTQATPDPCNTSPGTLTCLFYRFATAIETFVPALLAVGVAIFAWGTVTFIATAGNDQSRAAGKQRMIWGVITLFVIVSVWGLVSILQTLAGVNSSDTTCTPTQIQLGAQGTDCF